MQRSYYPQIRDSFFKHFKGLDDPKFLEIEKKYKLEASEKSWEILGEEVFNNYLKGEDYQGIIEGLKSICGLTNLINWRDFYFLRFIPTEQYSPLCKKIFSLVHEEESSLEERIDSLSSFLEKQKEITNSNIWNFVTYLLFIFYPKKYYFVKPSIWNRICKKLSIKDPRTPLMRASSYNQILSVCQNIWEELQGTDLEPRDMIDLQSLLYVFSGAYDEIRRYWVFKINEIDKPGLWQMCKELSVAAMQYEYETEDKAAVTRNLKKIEQISRGDYVVAALKGRDQFFGYGEVSEEFFEEKDPEKLFEGYYGQRIRLNNWDIAMDMPLFIKDVEENYAQDKTPFDTIFEISEKGFGVIKERLTSKAMEKLEYKLKDLFQKGFTQNVVLEGPPGTGKTYKALKTVEIGLGNNWRNLQFHNIDDYSKGAWEIVQFHPNYSFEDFVRGLVAEPAKQGVIFTPKDKLFAKVCREAENNPAAKFYLIIDEINRGDLSKILGELIFGLEYRGSPVSLLYGSETDEEKVSPRLVVPENLHIIGTMNTADRSIALVDYAIRRRFSFFKLYPDRSVLENYPGYINEDVRRDALQRFDQVQEVFNEENADYKIGHTYFLVGGFKQPGTKDALDFKYRFQVVPLLQEYVKEGILEWDRVKGLIDHE